MIIYGDTMVIFHTDIMGIYSEYHQQYDTKHPEVSLFAQTCACATPTTQPSLSLIKMDMLGLPKLIPRTSLARRAWIGENYKAAIRDRNAWNLENHY